MSLTLFAMLLASVLSAATLPPSAPFFDAPVPAGDDDDAAGKGASFSPSVFAFKVDVADDGTGEAGGWQKASATLKFFDWRKVLPNFWTCSVTVGVPLRTKERGKLAAGDAASITANIATQASRKVMHTKDEWPVAEQYCGKFRDEMLAIFRQKYTWIGARVER
jgi:hypothetical protein